MKESEHIALVTGTLAEPPVRAMAGRLAEQCGLVVDVIVLNIQVAALMTAEWVERKLSLPNDSKAERVILPGYCRGDLSVIKRKLNVPVEKGPCELQDLPAMFNDDYASVTDYEQYTDYSIEIIAEINDAAHLPVRQIFDEAQSLVASGADVIDIGCDPMAERPGWPGIGQVVRELRDRGIRVSVDSFHPDEVAAACKAGAELVLSVNSSNCDAAADWAAQVVVIPDDPHGLVGLDQTIERLEKQATPYRIDPIIEPIGFGFAQSLDRYIEMRNRYPDAPMMMGIGNLTEMTGVDSAGINMLLIGVCQELAINSVLTTQVINWARSAVREIDLARRMMHYGVTKHIVPKHFDENLVMLRDTRLHEVDPNGLEELATKLSDDNVRIFADAMNRKIHAMNRRGHVSGDDPFLIFDQLGINDPSHAFYLGYEMAKAMTAITLGKNYTQDQALNWGMLTREEVSHHDRRTDAEQ